MKTFKILFVSFLLVLSLSSCEREKRGGSIRFSPNRYVIAAKGGEIITSVASRKFIIYGASEPSENERPTYYHANKEGTFLEADCFTVERTSDYRLKIVIEPNTTGKERKRYIEVTMADDGGHVYLTQTAN